MCAHCSWGDVQRFQLRPPHGPAQCPDIRRRGQAHGLQIHEGGEAVQRAAPGQEGRGAQLVPPSQHLLRPHEETPLLWALQVLGGWEQLGDGKGVGGSLVPVVFRGVETREGFTEQPVGRTWGVETREIDIGAGAQ